MIHRLLTSIVVIYGFLCVCLYFGQDLLIFPYLQLKIFGTTPDPEAPADIDRFTVVTNDGDSLDVWTTYGKSADLTSPYVGLIFHGNGESASTMNYLPFFARHKIPAFTFDYRGYGRSTGWPSEQKILADAEAIWQAVKKKTGKDERHLIILGNSLGGAPASYLASKITPHALILIAAFASIPEVVNQIPYYRPFSWLLRYQLANVEYLKELKSSRVILAHGKKDQVVNFRHLEILQSSLMRQTPVVLVDENASHNDIYYAVENQLDQALDKCL